MFKEDSVAIQQTINNYFLGIFKGDIPLLEKAFHPSCLLIGDFNGAPYFKNVEEYLEGVKNRKCPDELGETFKMKVISIEILGNNALAKLHVPILGYNYYDFISLSKFNTDWLIVNKLFTNEMS